MNDHAALLLLPNLLGTSPAPELWLPAGLYAIMRTIDGLMAESEKEGRRYLRRFETKKPLQAMPIALCNEHTPRDHIDFLLEPILKGERWGLISDAGLPCLADPGSHVVLRAREKGIAVQALAGPSAILLALMLSGLPGQKFFFRGYLDRDTVKRRNQIAMLAQQARWEQATQLLIEAPYRNPHLLAALVQTLPEAAWLSVAWDLTLPTQGVITRQVAEWRTLPLPDLDKKPAIFLFC